MANKVLLLTGTSYIDQEKVLKFIIDYDTNFVRLNQEAIFYKVACEISDEYFSKDMRFVDKVTCKQHLNYLDLLYFLQKTHNKKLSKLYSVVNSKSQLANEIIIFRLYKEYFIEVKKIIDSGKNCIFIENIFYDPFPRRKDIFFDYFKFFADDFKILNVYTSIKTIILQTKIINQEFIEYVLSNRNAQSAYEDLIKVSINGVQSSHRLENPLFNFELYPLMFNICKTQDSGDHKFEVLTGIELKMTYEVSVLEMKKILGFMVLKSYPTFYQKVSILNEISSQFLYTKEFNDEDQLYVINKRLIFDYNLNMESASVADELNKFIQSCFNSKSCIHFNANPALKAHVVLNTVKHRKLSPQIIQDIRCLINSDRVFFINDINDKEIDYFGVDKDLIFKANLEYFFFLQTCEGWLPYVLLVQKNAKIKLHLQANLAKSEENLVFINNLYVSLHKVITKHFFINTVNLLRSNKKDLLKKTIYLLHYGNNI